MYESYNTSFAGAHPVITRKIIYAKVILSSSFDCLSVLIGAWRAGLSLASMPLPARGMEISSYLAQLETLCKICGAETLLVDAEYIEFLAGLDVRVVSFEAIGRSTPIEALSTPSLIQFTSGSTMEPKGVRIPLDAIAANVLDGIALIEPSPSDILCSWLPLSHDMGLIAMCLGTWVAGSPKWSGASKSYLIRPELFLSQPGIWLETCSAVGATITAAPNFALDLAASRFDAINDLSRLRAIFIGAEMIRASTLRHFAEVTGPAGFSSLALCPSYGLAEATLVVTSTRPSQPWQAKHIDGQALADGVWREVVDGGREVVAVGSPMASVDVRVDGGDRVVGLIEVRSPSLTTGYIDRPAPIQDGWLRTEDLGVIDLGQLYVVGRSDDILIVRGRKLYAPELETALAGVVSLRPGACAVVQTETGIGVVAEPAEKEASQSILQEAAREIVKRLVDTTGIAPVSVALVARGSLAKTPSGKIQRNRIEAAMRSESLEILYCWAG